MKKTILAALLLISVVACGPEHTATVAQQQPESPKGLVCDTYDLSATRPTALPSFSSVPSQVVVGPKYVDTVLISGAIDFGSTGALLQNSSLASREWVAVDCQGTFEALETAQYSLRLTADDGAKLFVDNVLVVNNDGVHSAQVRSASVFVAKGKHRIRLQYFNATGLSTLRLESNIPMSFVP